LNNDRRIRKVKADLQLETVSNETTNIIRRNEAHREEKRKAEISEIKQNVKKIKSVEVEEDERKVKENEKEGKSLS